MLSRRRSSINVQATFFSFSFRGLRMLTRWRRPEWTVWRLYSLPSGRKGDQRRTNFSLCFRNFALGQSYPIVKLRFLLLSFARPQSAVMMQWNQKWLMPLSTALMPRLNAYRSCKTPRTRENLNLRTECFQKWKDKFLHLGTGST